MLDRANPLMPLEERNSMRSRPFYWQLHPMLRMANVVFLTFLLANLVMPPGWVHRAVLVEQQAMADPPPDPEWPFGDDFVNDTLVSVHTTLFGAPEPDGHTFFYHTSLPIRRNGYYTGVNNAGQPFDVHVIRHYVYPVERHSEEMSVAEEQQVEQSAQSQAGLFWGTMSTGMGSVNVMGMTMHYPADPGTPGDPNDPPMSEMSGLMPIMDHDLLMSWAIPMGFDPNAPPGLNYDFNMVSEQGIGAGCGEGVVMCVQFDDGCTWCPDADPAVCLAKDLLDECIRNAVGNYVICMAIATAVALAGMKLCIIQAGTGWGGPIAPLCGGIVAAVYAIAILGCLLYYANAIRNCYAVYRIAYKYAQEAACPPDGT